MAEFYKGLRRPESEYGEGRLFYLFCRGKDMSFAELLKRISPTLKRITYKLNGHFSFFNDEDLFQEALLHLWQDYKCAKLNDKTDSYILQGCYFHLKNYIRCINDKVKLISIETSKRNEEEGNQDEFLWLRDQKADDFFEDLNSRLLCETIQNNGLTEREKEVLRFYSQGLTVRNIGKRLGISHVRVVKLTQRIREKCSKYLKRA